MHIVCLCPPGLSIKWQEAAARAAVIASARGSHVATHTAMHMRRREGRRCGGELGGVCNKLYFKFTHCWDSKFNFIVRCVVIILHNNISGNCFEIPGRNPETSLHLPFPSPPPLITHLTVCPPPTSVQHEFLSVFVVDYSILFHSFSCLSFRAQRNELNFCVCMNSSKTESSIFPPPPPSYCLP